MLRHLPFFVGAFVALFPALPAQAFGGCDGLPIAQRDQCLSLSAQFGPDCARVQRPTERLACWDRLHVLVNCPSGDDAVEALRCAATRSSRPRNVELVSARTLADGWTLRQEVSAFSDFSNVFLSVPSEGPATCGPRARTTLFLRCLDDQTAVYFVHDCATPLIGGEGWVVDLRLDDAPSERLRMTQTVRGDGFGYFNYRDARTLIEQLAGAEALHLRFVDIEGFSSELRFPVAGLSDRIEPLKAACGWSEQAPWAAGSDEHTD